MTVKRIKDVALGVFIWGTFILAFGLIALLAYWQFCPYPTVITFKGDYAVKPVVTQGELTSYTVNYCKIGHPPSAIVKEFVDGLVFTVDSPQAILTEGCRSQEIPMTIPHTLPAGRYRLRNVITYQLNPIRSVSYTHFSNWFIVKPSGDNDNDNL